MASVTVLICLYKNIRAIMNLYNFADLRWKLRSFFYALLLLNLFEVLIMLLHLLTV